MKARLLQYPTAILLVFVAWGVLFFQHILGIEILQGLPSYIPMVLALIGVAVLSRTIVGRQIRIALYVVALLAVAASSAVLIGSRDHHTLEQKWRTRDANLIRTTIIAVGENIQQLAAISDYIGRETKQFLTESKLTIREDTLAFNLEAFAVLKSLAGKIEESGQLPHGTEIGIQLLDDEGGRIAWAGWPQPLQSTDYSVLRRGEEILYTREVSLYWILTRVIPVVDEKGKKLWTVVVDTPLEVNYKVNNKYLRSMSLAENITRDLPVNVKFDYYATIERARERSLKLRSQGDSTFAGHRLPSYIETLSEIAGDKTLGLSGRAMIKSPLGDPLLNVTVHSRPFRHFADSYSLSFLMFARGCILLAFIIIFILSLVRFPHRFSDPLGAVKICYVMAFFVMLRFSLLSFLQAPTAGGLRIFDPAIFATPILGGLMRSAGDLLITAFFFIAALYAVLKITREERIERDKRSQQTSKISILWMGLLTAAVLFIVLEIAQRLVGIVVVNANPYLLGETMKIFHSHVLVLHSSVFLMLSGVFLAGILCIWGMMRIKGTRGVSQVSVIGLLLIFLAAAFGWRWEFAFISMLLVVFLVFAPRFTRREDLVSIVTVAFSFVVIVSGASYIFLNEEYQRLRKDFIREKAAEFTQPLDNWKVFILEDIMDSYSKDPMLRRALRNPSPEITQRLAFDLWAGSPLSLLGYSSAIYVMNTEDSVMGRFSVDMPFRMKPSEETERIEPPPGQEWVVFDLTKATPEGGVRFYRGIVNIEDIVGRDEGGVERVLLGKVIVDAPFSFENLAWAARTGPRTPELLRNVQEGSIEPRLESPEALLLAHLEDSRIIESSAEDLPVGMSLPEEELSKARELKWPLLRTQSGTYRYMIAETDDPERILLAGFSVPTLLWHVLRWSMIFSLYLFFTVTILMVIILLRQMPYIGSLLPTLTPGRRFGFQQKLLGSFLVVALLPAIIIGVFSVQVIRDRFILENKEEALYKALSARKSIVNLLSDELDSFLYHADLDALLSGEITHANEIPMNRFVRVVDESGVWLDEIVEHPIEERHRELPEGQASSKTMGEPSDGAARLMGDDMTAGLSSGEVWVIWKEGVPYIGILSRPIVLFGEAQSQTCYVYYARILDGNFLMEIADQVGADINVYDGGRLVASSREGLLTGGFISPVMNADAFVKVSLLGVKQSLSTERTGDYSYQVAYLPLESGRKKERAVLSLPLLFRPEPYYMEVQRATSIVLGIFALLFAATIGLGLLLARGIFRPLKDLLEGTKRISRGDLSFKLPSARSDEIGTVVNAFNDMTDQLDRSQRVLEERRRYLEVILVNIGTGVVSTDEEDRIRTVNNAAERILGVEASHAVGKAPGELVEEGIAPEIFTLLQGRSETDEPFISSEIDMARDGAKRTIKYMLTKLVFNGHYLGTVFVFEDLTELINSKKLSAWVEMARQIAHEIKNPLTPIKLSTQFMQRAHRARSSDFDRIFKESSDTIIHQVELLRRIAGEFSSFGRMQQLNISSHKLIPLIEDIIAPYRSNTAGVEISCDYACGDISVAVDSEAVRKICVNLIENAMEALPEGGLLSVHCIEVEVNDVSYAKVVFKDSGPGLNDEAQDKLFEPYFSTKTTGTGLGLAICRTLSREMGGEVTVENAPEGTGVEAVVLFRVG